MGSWRMPGRDATGTHPAVIVVAARARRTRPRALARLRAGGVTDDLVDRAIRALRTSIRLTVNFHPDRRDRSGRTVASGLLADDRYRPQSESGISNGSRSAVPGGDRTDWESAMFGHVYDDPSLVRPVYGALDMFHDPLGGSPAFGSSFLVLRPHCLDRATLCVGDSHLAPVDVGTRDEPASILAGATSECADGRGFGRHLSVDGLLDTLLKRSPPSRSARELDRYVEAQIHGGVDLAHDFERIVVDPSFRDTDVERDLHDAAERGGFDLDWNEGSMLRPDSIDPGFRGPDMALLARSVARPDGLVDAAAIGRALADMAYTEPSASGDADDSHLQRFKKLWQCCLVFGEPDLGR